MVPYTPASAVAALDCAMLAHAAGGGIDVEVAERIDSTNRVLMRKDFAGAPARPYLLLAASQSQGRGRRGRGWIDAAGASIAMSLSLERNVADADRLEGWPIAVGVAIAQALAPRVPDLRLKWPNDLQRSGRKCGGILVETRRHALADGPGQVIERVVVGVGLNLFADAAMLAAVDQPAGALFDQAGAGADAQAIPGVAPRETIGGEIAHALAIAWERFQREGLAVFCQAWAERDALAGESVCVIDAGRVLLEGVAEGIDDTGALKVRSSQGLQRVLVGDVSVRRASQQGVAA